MKIDINTVAKKAGVSTATISRVLNNSTKVREVTRKKVLKVVKSLNYEIDATARSLRKKKTYAIGLIVENVLSYFYAIIVKSVEDVTVVNGYNSILCNTERDPDKELKYLKLLKSYNVEGIILLPTGKNSAYLNNLINNTNIKIVFIDRLVKDVNCNAVLVDNLNGTKKAIDYLIKRGYERIAIITGDVEDSSTAVDRLKGYLSSLKEAGIKKDNRLIKFGDYRWESGYKYTKELMEAKYKPDCIFISNANMALGAITVLRELNINIPDDLGVMCFDKPNYNDLLYTPLTCIEQPIYDLGAKAVNLLINEIESKDQQEIKKKKPEIITLQTNFLIKNSTK
jgi:LacI family transcriptional regulator